MIKIKFREIRLKHRFTIQFIHQETGINRNTLTDYEYDKVKQLDINTLDRLLIFFNKYFECALSDLIEFTND